MKRYTTKARRMGRMSRKRRSRTILRRRRIQRGGAVTNYNVYLFTRSPATDAEKAQVLRMLRALYGDGVAELTGEPDRQQQSFLDAIKQFVFMKGGHYETLKNVSTFIIPIPDDMRDVDMNDPLLTKHEDIIQRKLATDSLPFKLTKHAFDPKYKNWGAVRGFGVWEPTYALIPLEKDPEEV
jgi:hypothetical protein